MMTEQSMSDQYLGCIVGAAAGDALGAATETFSSRQIADRFGGRVEDFQTPPEDNLAAGRAKGQVTDAFSIPYVLCGHLLAQQGEISRALAERALREWGESEWYAPFAGMTTRKVVKRLREDHNQELWSYAGQLGSTLFKSHYYALSSNGAAVKAWPAALLHPGDIDAAIGDTVELTMASHDDPLSISGACAISAAVCAALAPDATLTAIIEAAIFGAEQGERLARQQEQIWVYPGPSVSARLEMALELAICHAEDGMQALADLIGSGPAIAETVPTALALLVARQGDVLAALFDAVNIGDETAAIASLVGAIGGTWQGAAVFPRHYQAQIEQANHFDLTGLARRLDKRNCARGGACR